MAKMVEALKILYTGEDALNRQISFFSFCGIFGLINAYLALAAQDINAISHVQKMLLVGILIIFNLFFIGFETDFMHSRQLPDIDLNIFKISFKKIPFIIFLAGIIIVLANFYTKYSYAVFCVDTVISIPLTMILAGFSYNFDSHAFRLFEKFTAKEYFLLLVKKLYITIAAYIITFSFVFIIFFITGIVIALVYQGNITSISLAISSHQIVITKLSNYITGILVTYLIAIGILIWDYDMINMYEEKGK